MFDIEDTAWSIATGFCKEKRVYSLLYICNTHWPNNLFSPLSCRFGGGLNYTHNVLFNVVMWEPLWHCVNECVKNGSDLAQGLTNGKSEKVYYLPTTGTKFKAGNAFFWKVKRMSKNGHRANHNAKVNNREETLPTALKRKKVLVGKTL